MTEYWVSQAKHYCKYCNTWMQDNKMTRSHHDSGIKHKERVELFNKKKRDEKFHGMRNEYELKKQLDMIERSAREAMTADRSADGAPVPPAGFQSADLAGASVSRRLIGHTGLRGPGKLDAMSASDDLRQDSSGTYTVRGVTFYEGQYHEDKLRTGVECEIFVEAEDEWMSARIISRKEFPIPYTDRMQLVFDIRYSVDLELKPADIPFEIQAEDDRDFRVDSGVESDRLRLIGAEDGAVPFPTSKTGPLPPAVVENTGLGMWQTVSLTVVHDEEERLQALKLEHQLEEERISTSARKDTLFSDVAHIAESGDVLKAYDPYNSGVYKGIKVSKDSRETEIESLAKGKSVAFKKRKVISGASAAKKKNKTEDNGSSESKVEF